jgi:hypothetical protein
LFLDEFASGSVMASYAVASGVEEESQEPEAARLAEATGAETLPVPDSNPTPET